MTNIGLGKPLPIQIEFTGADSYAISADRNDSFDIESAVVPRGLEGDNVASLQVRNRSILQHPVTVKERVLH
jgi:hypothetical protein